MYHTENVPFTPEIQTDTDYGPRVCWARLRRPKQAFPVKLIQYFVTTIHILDTTSGRTIKISHNGASHYRKNALRVFSTDTGSVQGPDDCFVRHSLRTLCAR